jgi:hypothetical protein
MIQQWVVYISCKQKQNILTLSNYNITISISDNLEYTCG